MSESILVIGYGNPARWDDGLGQLLAQRVGDFDLPGVTVLQKHQLNPEDSTIASDYDVVIFADATLEIEFPFYFRELQPLEKVGVFTHQASPEAVLGMAHQMFGAHPKGYILGIQGYVFNRFGEELTPQAQSNLNQATDFIQVVLRERKFNLFESNFYIKDEMSCMN